ncbi:MAG: 3-keto-disaccharide hydrolase [Planctomycetota bacterium]
MIQSLMCVLVVTLMAGSGVAADNDKPSPVGYDDTPFLPGGKWRVHDINRPRPRVINPGTFSTTKRAGKAPSDAIVLFDGTSLDAFIGRDKPKKGEPAPPVREAQWELKDGYMEANKTGDLTSKQAFGSGQYHVEFATPEVVEGNSQGRGNSGFFLMGQYEIQILDSYQNKSYADGQAAALYGYKPPLVNASRKPGAWQTYDIIFEAPEFDGDKLVKPAYVTVLHNGVLVQNHVELLGASGHRRVGSYKPHPAKLPLKIQDHNNPTRFRSIWVRELD